MKLARAQFVEVEVYLKLWNIGRSNKDEATEHERLGSQNYQLILRRMQLLPSMGYAKVDVLKGKRKASVELDGTIQAKRPLVNIQHGAAEHVFDVITNSPTTGDMVFMTPGGAVAFYPEFTFNGIGILNGTLKQRPIRNFVGCMKHARYIIYNSTKFLQQPCGNTCPALWRNIVDGGPGALVLEWDLRYSGTMTMSLLHSSWQLAELCHNTACSFNSVNNARQPQLPPLPAPSDQWAIRVQEARMRDNHPKDEHAYIGLLYATRASAPKLVPIPLRDGLAHLKHINDLEVLHWVDCLGNNKFSVDMDRACKTYNITSLNSTAARGYGYTFFREHCMLYAPPNALIGRITASVTTGNSVLGNVLVVKHIRGNKHEVVDLTAADVDCINEVLIRTINHAEFWT
ncbi:hypothetical protein BD769DRAFT_1669243 [Suillus cothurnatus]|nr:hypothetical protein BD769DRAFT_1669243 [Suillus cothurnatus]